jgi:hypothetical protein
MTNLFLLTTVAVLSIATSPVIAAETRPATAPTTTAAPQAADATRVATSAKKYCVVDSITGSRIARKICKTRDAWLDQGFDPLAKQ